MGEGYEESLGFFRRLLTQGEPSPHPESWAVGQTVLCLQIDKVDLKLRRTKAIQDSRHYAQETCPPYTALKV